MVIIETELEKIIRQQLHLVYVYVYISMSYAYLDRN